MIPFQSLHDEPVHMLYALPADDKPCASIGSYDQRPHGQFTEHLPDPDVIFHPMSKYDVWDGGHLTCLPLISQEGNENLNALQFVCHKYVYYCTF